MAPGLRVLTAPTLSAFRRAFSGEIILPDDDAYDQARQVWNAPVDRHPAIIARCASEQDVVSAINLARSEGLIVAVRGGGHSSAGFSTCDNGIIIDLSLLRGVTVDRERRIARVKGGSLAGELDHAAHSVDLVCPVGAVASVGVAGLVLGGGVGRFMRKYGLTLDNVLSADVVSASGESVHASVDSNPELFWALRGGGGNFGVVTSLELALHPLEREFIGGALGFSIDRLRDVVAIFRNYPEQAPREVTASLVVEVGFTTPGFPDEYVGQPVIGVAITSTASKREFDSFIKPLRELRPIFDNISTSTYQEHQAAGDEGSILGQRHYWDGALLDTLPDEVVEIFVEQVPLGPRAGKRGWVGLMLMALGGAIRDVPDEATAFSGRRASFRLLAEGIWLDDSYDDAYMNWGQTAMRALEPFTASSVYINDLMAPDSARLKRSYGPKKYARLVDVKRIYDAENLFHLNPNIEP